MGLIAGFVDIRIKETDQEESELNRLRDLLGTKDKVQLFF